MTTEKTGSRRIVIFDTTLRDGEQSPGASMNLTEKMEVAEALAETSPARLRVELVQVAAVCVQWLEALGRRQCDAARVLFGDQTCPACGMEHPSQPCPQPDLFGGSDA